jgi:hypothetical protein
MLCAATCVAAAVLVPGAALADHGNRHSHHLRRQHVARRHHARIRHLNFSSGSTPGGPSVTGTTEMTGTTGMTGATGAAAVTVQSFSGGVLTLSLPDGSTVSGTVTNNTEIECSSSRDGGNVGDDFAFDGGHGPRGSGGQGDQGNSGPGDQGEGMNCSSALAPGAIVSEARLDISSTGKTWEKVELAG